jgi:hypothetical protein
MNKKNKRRVSIIFLLLIIILAVGNLIYREYSFIVLIAIILLSVLFFIANINWLSFFSYIVNKKRLLECPFVVKNACPYTDNKSCSYDKINCLRGNSEENKKSLFRKSIFLYIVFFASAVVLIVSNIKETNGNLFNPIFLLNWKNIAPILNAFSIAFLSSIFLAFLIDIPGRIKEYKSFFIELLSSPDYLKFLEEKKLRILRKKITLQLHEKNVPNMPRGLIRLDESICEMLSLPYYKEYRQNTVICDGIDENYYEKHHSIEYVVFNSYDSNHPVVFDLGFANRCMLVKSASENILERIEKTFTIKKFSIIVDDLENPIDLLNHMDICYKEVNDDELKYTVKITLAGKKHGKTREDPLVFLANDSKVNNSRFGYVADDGSGLFIKFTNRITVKFEYEINVSKADLVLTKRLRYPVKYFQLECTSNVPTVSLRGQLIGTLIEQSKITTTLSDDKKRLFLQTHDWLLPRNGAVVVMVPNDI